MHGCCCHDALYSAPAIGLAACGWNSLYREAAGGPSRSGRPYAPPLPLCSRDCRHRYHAIGLRTPHQWHPSHRGSPVRVFVLDPVGRLRTCAASALRCKYTVQARADAWINLAWLCKLDSGCWMKSCTDAPGTAVIHRQCSGLRAMRAVQRGAGHCEGWLGHPPGGTAAGGPRTLRIRRCRHIDLSARGARLRRAGGVAGPCGARRLLPPRWPPRRRCVAPLCSHRLRSSHRGGRCCRIPLLPVRTALDARGLERPAPSTPGPPRRAAPRNSVKTPGCCTPLHTWGHLHACS